MKNIKYIRLKLKIDFKSISYLQWYTIVLNTMCLWTHSCILSISHETRIKERILHN